MKSKKHPGFEAVAEKAAKRTGESMEEGRAMIAAATRRASKGAKKANPRLQKVKGKAK